MAFIFNDVFVLVNVLILVKRCHLMLTFVYFELKISKHFKGINEKSFIKLFRPNQSYKDADH